MSFKSLKRTLFLRVLPNIKYLTQSKIKICNCCKRLTMIASLSEGEEFKVCIWCRANLRYEMITGYLENNFPSLCEMVIVELDHRSPLGVLLSKAACYTRTYFSTKVPLGTIREDGSRCEDITRLTFGDSSIDIIISSDVLEHVHDIKSAMCETIRVLRPGGFHLFTVPPRVKTVQRALIRNGEVIHLIEPEYHCDPLNPEGILSFWDFGPDAISLFQESGLRVTIVDGPRGKDKRILWKAEKPL